MRARDSSYAFGSRCSQLIGVTAIRFVGAKWERELFNCRKWSFDTVVDAIGSNEKKFISDFVILQFERPAKE